MSLAPVYTHRHTQTHKPITTNGHKNDKMSLAPVYTHRHTNQTGLMATGMMRRTDILEKCLEVKHYHNYPDTIS